MLEIYFLSRGLYVVISLTPACVHYQQNITPLGCLLLYSIQRLAGLLMQFLVNSLTLQVLNTHRVEAEAGGEERNSFACLVSPFPQKTVPPPPHAVHNSFTCDFDLRQVCIIQLGFLFLSMW